MEILISISRRRVLADISGSYYVFKVVWGFRKIYSTESATFSIRISHERVSRIYFYISCPYSAIAVVSGSFFVTKDFSRLQRQHSFVRAPSVLLPFWALIYTTYEICCYYIKCSILKECKIYIIFVSKVFYILYVIYFCVEHSFLIKVLYICINIF